VTFDRKYVTPTCSQPCTDIIINVAVKRKLTFNVVTTFTTSQTFTSPLIHLWIGYDACGSETLSLTMPNDIRLVFMESGTTFVWDVTNQAYYFTLSTSPTHIHCTIVEYALFADAAATIPFSDPMVTFPLSSEYYSGFQSITIARTPASLPKDFYIRAKTRGGVTAVQKSSFEVTGHASSPYYTTFPTGFLEV